MGSSSTLTFFMMFRHARSIGGQDAGFNNKVIAASFTLNQTAPKFIMKPQRSKQSVSTAWRTLLLSSAKLVDTICR